MNINYLIEDLKNTLEKEFSDNFTGLVLFGSYAKGTQNKNSDVDLLITFKELPLEKIRRTELIYDLVDGFEDKYKVEINYILTCESEIGKSVLMVEIADYAKIIIDKNKILTNLFKSIEEDFKKKLVKKLQCGDSHILKFENV